MSRDLLPHLRTAWDEICIQVQGEESVFWDAYIEQMDLFLHDEIIRLSRLEQEAIWMQTDQGRDWEFDDERADNEPPVDVNAIVDEIRPNLLARAADWSNSAIRAQQNADGKRYLEEH